MELHIRDVSKTYSNGVQALKDDGYEFTRNPQSGNPVSGNFPIRKLSFL